jgi:replication-associated recombination protein RarA
MRLVFLYGPPGVGKLTVATALPIDTGETTPEDAAEVIAEFVGGS